MFRVDVVTKRSNNFWRAFGKIFDGMVIDKDLEMIPMIVHHDGGIIGPEEAVKTNCLHIAPRVVQVASEGDSVFGAADTNGEENVILVDQPQGGEIRVPFASRRRVQVKLRRLEDDNAILLQFGLERHSLGEGNEIEHGEGSF